MGVRCKDGIIFGTEKIIISKMMVSGTDKRINSVNLHIGCVSILIKSDNVYRSSMDWFLMVKP